MTRARLAKYPASSTESQWFFTRNELDHSPSIRQGMTLKDERRNRQRMIWILWQVRDASRRPQVVINAAATLLQRFYMRVSFQQWDIYTAVGAAFFLASKVEEKLINSKVVTSLIRFVQAHRDTQGRLPKFVNNEAAYASPNFIKLRKDILHYEETMLRMECFDMNLRHPHALFGKVVNKVWNKGKEPEVAEPATQILDCGWCIANDVLASPVCLLYQPQVIAASCLILACTILRVPLPEKPMSLSEQKTLWALGQEEGEEEDEDNRFEEEIYWLEWLGVRSDELRDPTTFILDNWNLAQDPFVRDEAERIRAKVLESLDRLAPWPPEPRKLTGEASNASAMTAGDGSSAMKEEGGTGQVDVAMAGVEP